MNIAEYYEDVPIANNKKFPLVMFSMGYYSYVEANTYLLCALASAGYIVASVGHAYEAVENDYEDGSYDLYDTKINKIQIENKRKAMAVQKKLLKKALSHEEALNEFEVFQNTYTPYIKGRVIEWKQDIERALEAVKDRYSDYLDQSCGVGVSGHSLGGTAASYWASQSSKADAIVLLASFPSSALADSMRLLSVYGSEDGVLVKSQYEGSRQYFPENSRELVIEGGNHAGFGDYGFQSGDKEALISAEKQQQITAEAVSQLASELQSSKSK